MGRSLPLVNDAPASTSVAVERTSPRAVRVSLTDRCDLACVYCRPGRDDGYLERRIDLDAWTTILRGLVASGVRRVRITGGEPLLHRDVVPFVAKVRSLDVEDLALTTNATRLRALARPLREAGLARLTVSLDTLDTDRFARMTRGGDLRAVLAGIDAALGVGFDEIKLNAVVVRGENDDELHALARFAWDRGITPRFLEVMAVGEGAKLRDRVVPGDEMRARLADLVGDDVARTDPDRGPAKYVVSRSDPTKRVGFITGTSDTFCAGCDRLRVASDGMLRPCLATNDGVHAENEARAGDVDGVRDALERAWAMKPDGTTWRGCTERSAASVSIRAIGG
ncbi:MAG: GTP 3',8-cyclase MoaA [Polyangiaceae bacterium]